MHNDIAREVEKLADDLGPDRKRSIGEVAKELKVETHVIRFWEEKFPQIKPEIGAGKRRYYYNKQLKVLKRIRQFLYEDGYTIAGLQKLLKKRKQNNYQDEDLDTILSFDISVEEKAHLLKKNSDEKFDLDDFISAEISTPINFKFRDEAQSLILSAKANLAKLKSFLVSVNE